MLLFYYIYCRLCFVICENALKLLLHNKNKGKMEKQVIFISETGPKVFKFISVEVKLGVNVVSIESCKIL